MSSFVYWIQKDEIRDNHSFRIETIKFKGKGQIITKLRVEMKGVSKHEIAETWRNLKIRVGAFHGHEAEL